MIEEISPEVKIAIGSIIGSLLIAIAYHIHHGQYMVAIKTAGTSCLIAIMFSSLGLVLGWINPDFKLKKSPAPIEAPPALASATPSPVPSLPPSRGTGRQPYHSGGRSQSAAAPAPSPVPQLISLPAPSPQPQMSAPGTPQPTGMTPSATPLASPSAPLMVPSCEIRKPEPKLPLGQPNE